MKKGFFTKQHQKLISDPMSDQNPITIQVLGICSALAITTQLQNAFVMTLAVIFVMISASMLISILRNHIPNRIRIIVQLLVVASLVALVDQILKAFLPDASEQLSVFIGLIITNCIIMGRLEAFAMGNKVWESFLDALGNALGYGWILVAVAFFRELLGSGKLMGYEIPGFSYLYEMGYMNNNLMILPPMALIIVGLIIWIQRSRNNELIEEN
ncbi:MAG: NADH:ubiquinone reductase (Na(+)-transporting) subunit D [Flavobacteriales bacterium]|nr:NADH:ubiquinone reductase (Na(+)-transporting) subunit D [Flavobacteriales bacterium]|tara:strand:+ start:2518 stop:3159 length:642 start_codon:yes stop_codon:yes gene_type:complete